MIVFTFDQESLQMVADAAVDAQNRVRRLEAVWQAQRHWVSGGGGDAKKDRRGKPAADLLAGQTGDVRIWDENAATAELVECVNPYSVDYNDNVFVRVVEVEGWSLPLAVPDQYTKCADFLATYVPQDA